MAAVTGLHLLMALSRIASLLAPQSHLHPARFARLHELERLYSKALDGKHLLLGQGRCNQFLRVSPTNNGRELNNLGMFVPTGGGKSTHLTSQILTWPHSMIINDPKGELFQLTAGYRWMLGRKEGDTENNVFVFDPTGNGHRYNPLAGMLTEDALYAVARQLLYEPGEGDGKAFTQHAILMLTLLFLAARKRGDSPFPFVRALSQCGTNGIAAKLNAIDETLATRFLDGEYTPKANYGDNKFIANSWEALKARLLPFLTETVVRSLAGNDFGIADLMRGKKPVTVYLRWPEQHIGALQPLMKLMWGTFIEQLKATHTTYQGVGCKPVLLLVDEAGTCPIPELQTHVATVRSRGMAFILAYQALSQLDGLYGKNHAKTILNNLKTKLFTWQADYETAKYVSDCLGDTSGFAASHTSHDGHETSEGKQEREIPLLSPQDILYEMANDDIIVFHRSEKGYRPIQAKRMDWRKYPILVKRQSLPPPTVHLLPSLTDIELQEAALPTPDDVAP
jgi:type IV secretion system protein VirD4